MFNPNVGDVFCSSIQIYKIGSIIELPDGTKVQISKINKDDSGNVVEIEFEEPTTKKKLIKKRN